MQICANAPSPVVFQMITKRATCRRSKCRPLQFVAKMTMNDKTFWGESKLLAPCKLFPLTLKSVRFFLHFPDVKSLDMARIDVTLPVHGLMNYTEVEWNRWHGIHQTAVNLSLLVISFHPEDR